jgi:glycosyl transferase, family 25
VSDPLSPFERRFVVNIPDRTDRRLAMQAELERIGSSADFFPALRFDDAHPFHRLGSRGAYMSHLSILRKVRGATNVLMMQDDLNFHYSIRALSLVGELPTEWAIFHGACNQVQVVGNPALRQLAPHEELTGFYFVAVNGFAIEAIIYALETFLSRKRNHPLGGPMPIDGAFNIFRQQNPQFPAFIADPAIGYPRSSRSDCDERKWFDNKFTSPVVDTARSLKNKVRSLHHHRI